MVYQNKKILILGFGISGKAAAGFLLQQGAQVIATDKNKEIIEAGKKNSQFCDQGLILLHEKDFIDLKPIDLVVVSPGIPQAHPLYQKALNSGKEVIGEVELACRWIQNPILAITGTNGKTTTTLLVEHVLNYSGLKARAMGNVGIPLTQVLLESTSKEDILVLELSSWQLETLRSQVIDCGVILNITPNHLDYHMSMESYAAAKIRMQNCLKPTKELWMGIQCYHDFYHLVQKDSVKTFGYSPNSTLFCDKYHFIQHGQIELTLPSKYQGKCDHNIENLMAAYLLCQNRGIQTQQFLTAFGSFKKPPHRIEFVRERRGVSYYDDSKGTNLEAVIQAVKSMQGNVILIAGGIPKGASYSPWIKAFDGQVRYICAIGEAAELLKAELGEAIPVEIFSDLEKAILFAANNANFGENVLLSPGCASYDMFKDYQHRGQEFKRLVNCL